MNQQKSGATLALARTGTGHPITDDSTPKWLIQIHDRIYRNIDLFNPTYPDVQPKSYKPLLTTYHPYGRLSSSELYKLDAAARARIKFGLPDFPVVVNRVRNLAPHIRDFFHHCDELDDVNDHDLACMMAIDGMFLLDLFINHHEIKLVLLADRGRTLIANLLDPVNQFPYFVMEEIISSNDNFDRFLLLPHRLLDFCRWISPFQLPLVYPVEEISEPLHLLDLLYQLVTFGGPSSPPTQYSKPTSLTRFFNRIGDAVFDISRRLHEEREGLRALTHPAGSLERVGIRFQTVSGFEAMGFDAERRILNLPRLDRRNLHSADVARNLAAYESAVCEPNSQILVGYLALMESLAGWDGKDDVVLKEASVVSAGWFESGPEWWARARRAERTKELRGVGKVGEMVEAVNAYYDGLLTVRWRMTWRIMVRVIWNVCYVVGKTVLACFLLCFLFLTGNSLIRYVDMLCVRI